jgi:hypothetical protein
MRLQSFRDVEIALRKLEDQKVESVVTTPAKEIITRVVERSEIDSYLTYGKVVHRLTHQFQEGIEIEDYINPIITDVVILGTTSLRFKELFLKYWDFSQDILPKTDNTVDIGSASKTTRYIYTQDMNLYGEAVSLPLHLSAANKVISKAINLTSATEVLGALPVNRGGTGAASFTADNVLVGNGTSAIGVVAGVTNSYAYVGSVGATTTSLQYKDHDGNNQTQTVLTGLTGSSGAMYFTKGVLTNAT